MKITLPLGILIPAIGTALGACAVFFGRKNGGTKTRAALFGLCAGVMSAASVFSLLLPSLKADTRLRAPFPTLIGFFVGVAFLRCIPLLCRAGGRPAFSRADLSIVLHNVPEGLAVGVAFASALGAGAPLAEPFALALGIAIQNFPEGAIISLPAFADGKSKRRAFWLGALSGAVEPIAALFALFLTKEAAGLLPYLLGFSAGAMTDAVACELIPDYGREDAPLGAFCFSAGFCLMMALDVLL